MEENRFRLHPSTAERQQPEARSSDTDEDDWSTIVDPNTRRRVQNRLAQRKFRKRLKQRQEEQQRQLQDLRNAGSAYEAPNPEVLNGHQEMSGLPWGGLSLRHVVKTGRAKEEREPQGSSREATEAIASISGPTQFQGHSVGLFLSQQFARGLPASYSLFPWPRNP